jgi:hypothetical protein
VLNIGFLTAQTSSWFDRKVLRNLPLLIQFTVGLH